MRRPEDVDLISGVAEVLAEESEALEELRGWKEKTKTFVTIGFL